MIVAWLTRAVEYTDCISAVGGKTSPTSVVDMILNNQIAMNFGEYGVHLCCHRSQVHFGAER